MGGGNNPGTFHEPQVTQAPKRTGVEENARFESLVRGLKGWWVVKEALFPKGSSHLSELSPQIIPLQNLLFSFINMGEEEGENVCGELL